MAAVTAGSATTPAGKRGASGRRGRRRSNGDGTVRQRPDGRWEGRYLSEDSQGRMRRMSVYGPTREAVATQLRSGVADRDRGIVVAAGGETVATFLATWIEGVKPTVGPRTWSHYEQIVRSHLAPRLGSLRLTELGPHHLMALYRRLLDSGRAPNTVRHVHVVMHHALRDAMRWRLLTMNVASLATPPRVLRHEMETLDPDQVRTLLGRVAGDRLEGLYVLAVTSGLRQGELLALRWRDVNLEAGTLRVVATLQRTTAGLEFLPPKTARSRRQVVLTDLAVRALRRHRTRQLEERLAAGPAWQQQAEDLVFTSSRGRSVDSQDLRRWLRRHLAAAGLPTLRFHDLRHTAATLMLTGGVHPKVASEMLGHSGVAITLDLYSHVTPTMQKEAAATLDALLGGRM